MNLTEAHIQISEVKFRDEKIFFLLEDGREISAALKWYPKLYQASIEELLEITISPRGYGAHFNKVDEDLSAYGMLSYTPQKNIKTV
jgi:hypothetical protein